jgi:hypothetical protein
MSRSIPIGCAVAIFLAVLFGRAAGVSLSKVDRPPGPAPTVIQANGVLIETYENGKLTSVKFIADYVFLQKDGVWRGYWRHICMTPVDDDRSVRLKIESWSTDNGDITNLQSFSDGCSFDLAVGSMYGRRSLQVIVKQEGMKNTVLASGLWHSEIGQTELKKEWRSTNKLYFELPYSRVF